MALAVDLQAQEFTLNTTTGKPVVLAEILKRGPAVLAFFKVGCPVCQYAFPYIERLWQLHKTEPVSFVGVSQDNLADTEAFMKKYGVTFPVVLDDPKAYKVSKAYKLTNVPTVYLVDRDGSIRVSSVGWVRKELEDVNVQLSMMDPGKQQFPIFKSGEEIAEFKAG